MSNLPTSTKENPQLQTREKEKGSHSKEQTMKQKFNQNKHRQQSDMENHWKSFHDSVHGTIMLHPLLVAIIDTPQFQRLRDIKQLGGAYWVFPGACHNRFEHCIGTSYLCGKMLSTLKHLHQNVYKDPIEITDEDTLCVKIAGLCHDLGHGPFSHLFDGPFLKRCKKADKTWTHEQGSCDLFDEMIEKNERVQKIFDENGIGEFERDLIKAMILGEIKPAFKDKYAKKVCEIKKKQFLFEIVSNKTTGIDCDKFDYFARDTHHAGIRNSFDFNRYFKNVRIIPIDGELRICARDKEESNLYELFHIRWTLHRQVYQHKTTQLIEEFLVQALLLADREFGISSSVKDTEKYTLMTDSIFYRILFYPGADDDVNKAKEMLQRIQKRDLYRFCGETNSKNVKIDDTKELSELSTEIAQKMGINKDDIFVARSRFNFGKKGKNPLEEMKFFGKDGKVKNPQLNALNSLLPRNFEESYIRVFCTDPDKFETIEKAFQGWCDQ